MPQHDLQFGALKPMLFGLLDEEVGEDHVAGDVTPQDRVKADVVTGGEARLHEKNRGHGRQGLRRAPDDAQSELDGGRERFAQAVDVLGVADLVGRQEREDASGHRHLDLVPASGQGIGETDPGTIIRSRGGRGPSSLHLRLRSSSTLSFPRQRTPAHHPGTRRLALLGHPMVWFRKPSETAKRLPKAPLLACHAISTSALDLVTYP